MSSAIYTARKEALLNWLREDCGGGASLCRENLAALRALGHTRHAVFHAFDELAEVGKVEIRSGDGVVCVFLREALE